MAGEILALLQKDLRSELRTRSALNATLLFALSALVMVSFALGPAGLPGAERPAVLAALLWIILFFTAMMGLSRVFVKEEEQRTAPALRLAAPPEVIFLGKLAFNILLLGAIIGVTVPSFMLLLEFIPADLPGFLAVLALAGLGLAISSTLIAAIIAKAQVSGPLFSVLCLPVMLPLVLLAVNATKTCAIQADSGLLNNHLRLLISYDGVTFVAGALLFPFAWME